MDEFAISAKKNMSARVPTGQVVTSNASENRQEYNLFTYQQQVMPVLLGWGVGSIVSGLIWMRSTADWLRGLGSQFLGWGIVDSLIAAFAIRNAAQKNGLVEVGEITQDEHHRQSVQFERIVWLNALLDIGYIFGGIWLAKRNPTNQQRQGMGWGILIQGGFLFIWDVLLASVAKRKRSVT